MEWGDVGAGGAPLHRFAVPLALSGEALRWSTARPYGGIGRANTVRPYNEACHPTYSSVLGKNLQNMAVGVLDEINPGRQLVKDQSHGPVLCLETVEVLGHQGHVGGVVPQLIGFRPGGLLAQLQLEVGDAVPQEDQLPAPVGHVQLPLDGQVQGLLIKCSAAGQIQHPDADMVHGNHRMFLPLLDFCPHFTTEPEGGQGRSFFQKKGKSLYANRQKWGMI